MIAEIGNRYSKALFDLTKEKDLLKTREQTLHLLTELMEKNRDIATFFYSPQISKESKKQLIHATFSFLKDETLLSFLCLLIDKGRINCLKAISKQFTKLAEEELKVLKGSFKSAVPLEPDLMVLMKDKLEQLVGKQVHLTEAVDPTLLGGGVIVFGDKFADFSLKEKLLRLKKHLLGKRI